MTPRIIIEEPAVSDELEGHGRVAKAIVTAVRGERGLRFIGVLGRWGSGKSTVVRMLEEQLVAAEPDWLVFTYDAWAHQSDPHRRSFLESLNGKLESSVPGIDADEANKEWRDAIAGLPATTETTETRTTPELTDAGKWILASIIFLPLGVKLIGDGVFGGGFALTPASFFFTLGWILALLPLLIAGRFWLRARVRKEAFSPLNVIANKAVETKHEVKTKAGEPSSIEFQRILAGASHCCARAGRRLLIVVDNLDRLPASDAVSLWATVRGMFLGPDSQKRDKDGPLVLVPVDEVVVASAYSQVGGTKEQGPGFLDKTFDLVFRVPPPVQSNWQTYAFNKLKYVFENRFEDAVLHHVVAIVDQYLIDHPNIPVTPRGIIKLANALAVLAIQWSDESIPLPTMAVFHLNQEEIESGVLQFVSQDRPHLNDLDPQWGKNIAALHYGVPPDQALQVLLGRRIRSAVGERDEATFKELTSVPGFGGYLNRLLREVRDGQEHFSPLAVVSVLAPIEAAAWTDQSWALLEAILSNAPYAESVSDELVSAIEALIAHLPEQAGSALIRRQWKSLERRLEHAKAEDVASISGLFELLRKQGSLRGFAFETVTVRHPSVFEQLAAMGPDEEQWRLIEYDGDALNLTSPLQRRLASGIGSLRSPEAIAALSVKYPEGVDWSAVASSARQAVESDDPFGSSAGLKSLLRLTGLTPAALGELRTLHDNGVLQARLNGAVSAKNKGDVTDLLAAFLRLGEGPSLPSDWVNTVQFSDSDNEELAKGMISAGAVSPATLISSFKRQPNVIGPVRALFQSEIEGAGRLQLDPTDFLANVRAYVDVFTGELSEKFHQWLLEDEVVWGRISAAQLLELEGVLDDLLAVPSHRSGAASRVLAVADRLGLAWIRGLLAKGGPGFDLLLKAGRINELTLAVHQALLAMGDDTILTNGDQTLRQRWFQLTTASSPETAKAVLTTIADRIASGANVEEPASLFTAGGEPLRKAVKRRHYDGLVRHALRAMVTTEAGRAWVSANSETALRWLAGAAPGSVAQLRGQLLSLGAEGGGLLSALRLTE